MLANKREDHSARQLLSILNVTIPMDVMGIAQQSSFVLHVQK